MFIGEIFGEGTGAGSKVSAKGGLSVLLISITSGYCLTSFEPAPLSIILNSTNIRLLTESNLPAEVRVAEVEKSIP